MSTVDYTKYTKEKLFDVIANGCLPCLKEMERQLLAYGFSSEGILMNSLRRKLQEKQGLPVEPEVEQSGKNLKPIVGHVRI